MRQTASVSLGLVFLIAFSVTGCGGVPAKPKENLVPVSGKVTITDKPEAGIGVIFTPVNSNIQSHGGTGMTDAQGRFRMKNYMNLDGLPAGEYAVTFTWMQMADGTPMSKDKPMMVPSVTATERIPPLWNSLAKQGKHNLVTIPAAGKEDFDFKISSK